MLVIKGEHPSALEAWKFHAPRAIWCHVANISELIFPKKYFSNFCVNLTDFFFFLFRLLDAKRLQIVNNEIAAFENGYLQIWNRGLCKLFAEVMSENKSTEKTVTATPWRLTKKKLKNKLLWCTYKTDVDKLWRNCYRVSRKFETAIRVVAIAVQCIAAIELISAPSMRFDF